MALPFTVEQFYGVFRDHNVVVWPMQWILVTLAVAAILGLLWAWTGLAYHLAFFSRISPVVYAVTAISFSAAAVFVLQGAVRRRLTFCCVPGPRVTAGAVLIACALIVPVLRCAVGARAAFPLGVQPDLSLIAAGAVGLALLLPLGRPLRARTS